MALCDYDEHEDNSKYEPGLQTTGTTKMLTVWLQMTRAVIAVVVVVPLFPYWDRSSDEDGYY